MMKFIVDFLEKLVPANSARTRGSSERESPEPSPSPGTRPPAR